ncbi:hypothetical protein GCM10019059_40190 [Camelimonas fluminis]|uniref:Acyltransferase n=1 Tax=Camelimonas fluminis TaxID=1576911 RepID=A0ABV7UGF6_9HYPH|nr:acyltransferase [Camelimonas fluminis]GHE76964.1 hypothetical protein GCM10019059_40190 [Camelimonas fluminis]
MKEHESSKYFILRNYTDFLVSKLRYFTKKVQFLGRSVKIHRTSNIALSCVLDPWSGSITLGPRNLIDTGVVIRAYTGNIITGSHVTIGPYSVLYGGANLIIGQGVRVGPHVTIVAANHIFEDKEKFIFLQGMKNIGIEISDDVWIGAHAVILDGVQVGCGAVIAAGAVVTKSVGAWEIVGGVPARVIGIRGAVSAECRMN